MCLPIFKESPGPSKYTIGIVEKFFMIYLKVSISLFFDGKLSRISNEYLSNSL